MAFALLFIGVIFLVSAVKGNQSDLFALLKKDFTGQDNFIYWIMAVIVIVSLGNIKAVKPVTDAFLVLILVGIVFAQYRGGKDLFASFIDQVKKGTA